MSVSARLKAERERLDLSQSQMAALMGVGKTTVINWEKGASAPDAVQLGILAGAGADVLYVVTGQRSQSVPTAEALPREESAWLDLYRDSTPEMRAALRAAGDAYTKAAKRRDKAA